MVKAKTSVTIRPVLGMGSEGHHEDLSGEREGETVLWSCQIFIYHPKKSKD